MGTDNPNIVVGINSTGTHNIGRDAPLDPNSTPIENQVGATYHVGVGGDPVTKPHTQSLQGDEAGLCGRYREVEGLSGFGARLSSTRWSNSHNVVASKSSTI